MWRQIGLRASAAVAAAAALGSIPAAGACADPAAAMRACTAAAAAQFRAGAERCVAVAPGTERRACLIVARAVRVEALAACHEQRDALRRDSAGGGGHGPSP